MFNSVLPPSSKQQPRSCAKPPEQRNNNKSLSFVSPWYIIVKQLLSTAHIFHCVSAGQLKLCICFTDLSFSLCWTVASTHI